MRVNIRFKFVTSFLFILLLIIVMNWVAIVNMHTIIQAVQSSPSSGVTAYHAGVKGLLIVSALAVLVGAIVLFRLARMVAVPIRALAGQLQAVTAGNLARPLLVVKNRDEIGDLANTFNEMTRTFRGILTQITLHSEQVAATAQQLTANAEDTSHAAGQIALSIVQVTTGMNVQASSAHQTKRAVDDANDQLKTIANSMDTVAGASQSANEQVERGNEVIASTVRQMHHIEETVSTSADYVARLEGKSEAIGEIVSVIRSIAKQTNLLALNAAIEASRAGEQGRGFAVVAGEIRQLAEASTRSSTEIQNMIMETQSLIQQAVEAMQTGKSAVQDGMVSVENAGHAFEQIMQAIAEVSRQTQEASASMQNIEQGTSVIGENLAQITGVSQQSASDAEKITASVEAQNTSMADIASASLVLTQMASRLQDTVSVFQLSTTVSAPATALDL